MNITDVRENVHRTRPPRRDEPMEYKQQLRKKIAAFPFEQVRDSDTEAAGEEAIYAEQVRRLAVGAHAGGVAFQSVAVTALQVLERVARRDGAALAAALSLGQREKLGRMQATVCATARALRQALSEQGAQMLHLCTDREPAAGEDKDSWWFALTEAVEVLEDGTQRMDSLAAGQPEGAARRLGEMVSDLLRRHHAELLFETEQWIA